MRKLVLIASVSLSGCNVTKIHDTINYITFPELDSTLSSTYSCVTSAKYPFAVLWKERNSDHVYNIYIDESDRWYEKKDHLDGEKTRVQKLSNRFLRIGKHKVPIYFNDYDMDFYVFKVSDSTTKRSYSYSVWHGPIIQFDIDEKKIVKIYR